MLLLLEGASDEAVGHRAILLSQGPCHVKMVGSSRAIGGGYQPHFSEDVF